MEDEHLFNSAFDDARLRDELLNRREQNVQKSTGRVRRYRPGVVPDWVRKKEEEERNKKEQTHSGDISVTIEKKKDPRLERLMAAQEQRGRSGRAERPARRRHVEAEIIIDDDEKPEKFDAPIPKEDPEATAKEDADRRKRLLSRALEEEEEELEVTEEAKPAEPKPQEESEYEYEYDEDSEDEGTLFALRHRPVFVSKDNRKTIQTEEEKERQQREAEERAEQKKKQHYEETQKLIVETNLREIEEQENAAKRKDPYTLEDIPDDTDDLEDEAEVQAWKEREFRRIMKARTAEEQRRHEEEEKARREKMTDAELQEENQRLEEAGVRKKKQEHVQGTFLQKYYHKGIFYLDDESIQNDADIRNRDFHVPTQRDRVDKKLLPKVMQVRDFGKRSQSKWTYLRNEDTTKEKDWLNELQTQNAEAKFKHAGNK